MKNSDIHYFTVFKKATLLYAITNFSLVYSNNAIQSHQRITNTHNIRGNNDPKNRQVSHCLIYTYSPWIDSLKVLIFDTQSLDKKSLYNLTTIPSLFL